MRHEVTVLAVSAGILNLVLSMNQEDDRVLCVLAKEAVD